MKEISIEHVTPLMTPSIPLQCERNSQARSSRPCKAASHRSKEILSRWSPNPERPRTAAPEEAERAEVSNPQEEGPAEPPAVAAPSTAVAAGTAAEPEDPSKEPVAAS